MMSFCAMRKILLSLSAAAVSAAAEMERSTSKLSSIFGKTERPRRASIGISVVCIVVLSCLFMGFLLLPECAHQCGPPL